MMYPISLFDQTKLYENHKKVKKIYLIITNYNIEVKVLKAQVEDFS